MLEIKYNLTLPLIIRRRRKGAAKAFSSIQEAVPLFCPAWGWGPPSHTLSVPLSGCGEGRSPGWAHCGSESTFPGWRIPPLKTHVSPLLAVTPLVLALRYSQNQGPFGLHCIQARWIRVVEVAVTGSKQPGGASLDELNPYFPGPGFGSGTRTTLPYSF